MKSTEIYFFILWKTSFEQGDHVSGYPAHVFLKNINVYATTNPKHTLKIAGDAFKLAERGNIKKLVVFQQEKEEIRKFGKKGVVIYNKR